LTDGVAAVVDGSPLGIGIGFMVARWVHGLAILTVAATLPLFFLGADVTTKGAGMADQRAVVNPLQAIEEFSTGERSHGWKIEHLHRLAGWFIGMCGIALAVSLWFKETRLWVRWLGTAALLLIIVQGLLGIFRVHLHAILGSNLAWIHGSFASLVLGVLMSLAVVTSKGWSEGWAVRGGSERGKRLGLVVCVLVYGQLVIGGMVRHHDFFLGARLHLVMAFVAAGGVLLLAKTILDGVGDRRPAWVLMGMLGVQLLLGVEAWINRFHHPVLPWNQVQPWPLLPSIPRTLHFVVGAFLFATCVAWTVNQHRPLKRMGPANPESARKQVEVLA